MHHSRWGPRMEAMPKSGIFQSSWPRWALSVLIQAPVATHRQLPPLAHTWRHVYILCPLLSPLQSRRSAAVMSRGSAVSALLAIPGLDEVACSPSHSVPSGCSQACAVGASLRHVVRGGGG